MPKRISSVLGVSATDFAKTGAFDGFVDIDSKLHVDPHLLSASKAPELSKTRKRFETKFAKVLKLLKASKRANDPFWRAAKKLIQSKEVTYTGLGYAKGDTGGSGIGPKLAEDLTDLAKQIIDAGVTDIEIFELLGLFQEGVGADRISDLTVVAILPDLLRFSQSVARQLKVKTVAAPHGDESFDVPVNPATGRPLVLVPQDILRKLPVARSWSDIDRVAAHNAELRRRVNPIIGSTWKKATSQKVGKDKFRKTVATSGELLKDLVARYRSKPKASYDFDSDPDAVFLWHALTQDLALATPLGLAVAAPLDGDKLKLIVKTICERFKRLVEDNRLSRLLYNDDGSPRKEKVAQLAFFGLADAYCDANDLDISPEADGGSGPVDFKISKGYRFRVTVEMKLSSNPNLLHGFESQLPTYQRAEQAFHGVYLIVKNGNHDARIKKLEEARRAAVARGERVPDLIVIDGRRQASASKR